MAGHSMSSPNLEPAPERGRLASTAMMLAGLVGGYGLFAWIGARFMMPSSTGRMLQLFVMAVHDLKEGDTLLYRTPDGHTVNITRRGSGDRASVAVVVEGRGTQPLDLFIAAANSRGEMQASKRGALKAGSDGRAQATSTFQLKPGRYHLRVAAVQPETGARGSVMYDVDVPDFSKEDLSLGGLAVIDTARGRSPTARRSFAASESIDIAAEVYWRRGLAEPISITTSVVDGAGNIVFAREGTVVPAERPTLGVDMGTTINLERLEPGAYRLAVEAKTTGKRALTARRELPFAVSAR